MSNENPQAQELNNILDEFNPHILKMLSSRGRGIFFPKKGILAQSAEAKGKEINATIGIALEDNGTPLRLTCLEELIKLNPNDVFPYAPSFGLPRLRTSWHKGIYRKNPSLSGIATSIPVVSSALTHGLSICGYLFFDEGDCLYTPDLFWGNYKLIFQNAFGSRFKTYDTFSGRKFNCKGLQKLLSADPPGKRIVSLNFPNNPTGYTPTFAEAEEIRSVLVESAEAGNNIVALIDDAYFGLVYEEGILKESMFGLLANAHERILAVKIDGPTKEDYAWGFRVGFLTYAVKGGTPDFYSALEAKTAGAIRGNVSNSPHLSQSLLDHAYNSEEYATQKKEKYSTLNQRYGKIKEIFSSHSEYQKWFTPLPFNSGYFMCIKTKDTDPERVRQILLKEYSTGVIVAGGVLRVAFSSTPFSLLEKLYNNIYEACRKAAKE